MEDFVQQLAQFEKKHLWWPDKMFLSTDNKNLKESVDTIFQANKDFIECFAEEATPNDLDELYATVKDSAPRMVFGVFAAFLDHIHTLEENSKPFSHAIVHWYREKGWKFPEFTFETAS